MDSLSRNERSERMSRVRSRDTQPELLVRRVVHANGYRYKLHDSSLPGRPDLVFKRLQKIIFVHGCFWHRHAHCKLARIPKSRLKFWLTKLDGNRKRDCKIIRQLRKDGWDVLIIWECQLSRMDALQDKIKDFLGRRNAER